MSFECDLILDAWDFLAGSSAGQIPSLIDVVLHSAARRHYIKREVVNILVNRL